MAESIWNEMRAEVDSQEWKDPRRKTVWLAATDFAELFVWWANSITGKLVHGDLTLSGLSCQPQNSGDGFCITIRGRIKKTDVVAFHICKTVLVGLADARARILTDQITWKADKPFRTPTRSGDDEDTETRYDTSVFE